MGENVAEVNFVLKSNNQVKAAWMQGQCKALFCISSRLDLQLSGIVVPDADSLVLRACRNQLLTNTDIQAGDLRFVEGAHHVRELRFGLDFFDALNLEVIASLNKLTGLSNGKQLVFVLISSQADNPFVSTQDL